VDRARGNAADGPGDRAPQRAKRPYEPPRVLTDEAFEQISLACRTKTGTKKNFT
jgi:hypothetical protein